VEQIEQEIDESASPTTVYPKPLYRFSPEEVRFGAKH
jgi:hypothetical protein